MQALVHYGGMCVGNKCLRKLLRDVKIVKLITRGWVGLGWVRLGWSHKKWLFSKSLIYSIIIFNKIDKLLLMD